MIWQIVLIGMIWIIIIANIIAAVIALGLQRWLILLCYLRPAILVPMVLGTMLVGATMANQAYGDVVVFVIFGILGYLFKHTDWPRVPLIMGLIMGGLAERYLFLSIDLHGFNWLTDRPIVWVIALVTFVIVFLPPILRNYRSKKIQKSNDLGVIKK